MNVFFTRNSGRMAVLFSLLMLGQQVAQSSTGTPNIAKSTYLASTNAKSLAAPVITLNTPFDDGYLNIVEANTVAGRTLSGNAGDAISITVALGGQLLTTQLSGGIWTATITPAQLALLADGTQNIEITATANNGSTTVLGSQAILAIKNTPIITIETFIGLDGLNYAESRAIQLVSGTSTDLEVGQRVALRLNGVDYLTRVLNDGTWSLAVPSSALQVLANTQYTLSVSSTDRAGNPTAPSSRNFNVNLTPPPTIMTINPISTDNRINAIEIGGNITISGRSIGPASAMTMIQLTINGVMYQNNTIITDVNGNWSVAISALPYFAGQGPIAVTATSNDATLTTIVTVDTVAPDLNIVTFAGDNKLNATEMETAQQLSGTASPSEAGQLVNLSLNARNYYAQVSATGTWSTDIPAAHLAQLNDGFYTITATLADKTGNATTDTQVIQVDASKPAISSVSVPANATYGIGKNLDFTVVFSEAISVGNANNLRLALTIGSKQAYAIYVGKSAPEALLFRYTVVEGDLDTDGISINGLEANGAVIRDALNNDASLVLTNVGATNAILVDGIVPAALVTSVSFSNDQGLFITDLVVNAANQTISGTLSAPLAANEKVMVSLDNGIVFSAATSSVGSTSWSFNVTLAGNNTLVAKVIDAAGNSSTPLTALYVLDIDKPTAGLSSAASSPTATSPIPFTITFSEEVYGVSKSSVSVTNGTVQDLSGSGTTYNFTVIPTAKGDVSVSMLADVVRDLAGNFNIAASPITVTYEGTLPVELVSFNAIADANAVRLNWTTQSETNNELFTLLRSDNKLNLVPIATLKGQGTTQTSTDYTFIDKSPLAGTNYYQLKQKDFNGETKEIGLKAVEFKLAEVNKISVFPNPATSLLNVKFEKPTHQIELIDLNGRVVRSHQLDLKTNQYTFDVSTLSAGVYLIRLYQHAGTENIKFIKR